MASILNFTTCDSIRAVLGVAPEELEDATIELPLYVTQLQFEFTDIASGLEAAYTAITSIPPASRTAPQQLLFDTTQVFSAYAIGKILLTSLSTFAPVKILDGRAEVGRITDPFSGVRDGVNANYDALKKRLANAYQATLGSVATAISRSYYLTTGLATDPITGT